MAALGKDDDSSVFAKHFVGLVKCLLVLLNGRKSVPKPIHRKHTDKMEEFADEGIGEDRRPGQKPGVETRVCGKKEWIDECILMVCYQDHGAVFGEIFPAFDDDFLEIAMQRHFHK